MKEVDLITFKSEQIMVDSLRNHVERGTFDRQPNIIRNSREYVPSFVEVENIPIQLIVDSRAADHYIAVDKHVWEYLYILDNPVTGQTLQNEINELRKYKSEAMVSLEIKSMNIKKLLTAGFWTRVKWLFTGAKL